MAITSSATIQTAHRFHLQTHRLSFRVCSVPYISARDLQIHLEQYRASPDTGISTHFLYGFPDGAFWWPLLAMKTDMALPLNLTLKPLQPCNVQMAMRLTVQRNLQQGSKDLKDDQRKHKAQVVGLKKFLMRLAAVDGVDFTLVVAPLRIGREVIYLNSVIR
ncbi:hypothetical protein BDR03DRAFT_966029 [Suillus americanus]|nr:hypothetical protein BDR03DRAFT_966029 [Suillus americanus]